MKKITILSLLLVGAFFTTQAQITIGAKAGINVANQKFDADGFSISPDARLSYLIGGFAVIDISDNIGFQPELLLSGKGAKSNGFKAKLTYIDLPLLGRYSFTEMFSVHAGPQISILASAKDEDGDDIKDGYTSTDLGLAVGGQVDLPMGLVGGLRYVLGLSDVNDAGGGTKVKNRTFQIYAGWKFMK
ncbi:MAG TPA: porin family protein [Fulvivirga sp.]|nr:porin family protein [Fulvivirga sp.]